MLIRSWLMPAAILSLIPETYHPMVSSHKILMGSSVIIISSYFATRLEKCAKE